MAYVIYNPVEAIARDTTDVPESGAKLWFRLFNTTTPVSVYQDPAGASPHTNPVLSNADGSWPAIYWDNEVRTRVLKTGPAAATPVSPDWQVDDIGELAADGLDRDLANVDATASEGADFLDAIEANAENIISDQGGDTVPRSVAQVIGALSISVFDFMPPSEVAAVKARTSVADYLPALEAAYDALTPSGGRILFPATGLFNLSDGWTHDGTKYVEICGVSGEGVQPDVGTELLWPDNATHGLNIINGTLAKGSRSGICDLVLNGSAEEASDACGLILQANMGHARRCTFKYWGKHGVHVLSALVTPDVSINANNFALEAIRGYYNYDSGVCTEGVDSNAGTITCSDLSLNDEHGWRNKSGLDVHTFSNHFNANGTSAKKHMTGTRLTMGFADYKEDDALPAVIIDADSSGNHFDLWALNSDGFDDNMASNNNQLGSAAGGRNITNWAAGNGSARFMEWVMDSGVIQQRFLTGSKERMDNAAGSTVFNRQVVGTDLIWASPGAGIFDLQNTLQVAGLINNNTVPANASSTGVAKTIAVDASFIYVCTAANTWKRVAIATW